MRVESDLDESGRCPETEFAPQTPEGRAVAEIMNRPGVWKGAGMDAVPSGLDLAEAMASLPRGLDRDFARRLLIAAEAAFLAAWWRSQEQIKKA